MTTSTFITFDAKHMSKLLLFILLFVIIAVSSNLSDRWVQAPKCPVTKKALPHWIATEKCWRRNAIERGSWVMIAIGMKSTPVVMSAYFCDFIASAVAAAEPARVLLARTWDTANVFEQVASHARQRPLDQGTCVALSGRLPLPVHSECGSRVASVPDLMNARQSTSLIWLWRKWRPDPKRQDMPWWPSTVTVLPQAHVRADNCRSKSQIGGVAVDSVVHLVSDTRQWQSFKPGPESGECAAR